MSTKEGDNKWRILLSNSFTVFKLSTTSQPIHTDLHFYENMPLFVVKQNQSLDAIVSLSL